METNDIIQICDKVLKILCNMDDELSEPHKIEYPLIFPQKIQSSGTFKRISEQELSMLFIDEFKRTNKDLFYSIETPTKKKYRFKGEFNEFSISNKDGQSASIDLTIFKKNANSYDRILNVEFKFNGNLKSIAKDILKLFGEQESGAFIHLLKNSNKGTFCNKDSYKGLFNKYYKSIKQYQKYWENDNKFILIVFLILEKKTILYKEFNKSSLGNLKSIFMVGSISCNDEDLKNREEWIYKKIED